MNNLYQDKDGKTCVAKMAYVSAFLICAYKILFAGIVIYGFEMSALKVDYTGLTQLLTVTGAAYFARSHTKSKEVK